MTILALETSFDETSAAIVNHNLTVPYQFFATSIDKHLLTGGVVPEVASREQALNIIPVIQNVIANTANNDITSFAHDIDTIAVTVGPGLIGSLLIGVETAKALAYAWDKPIVPVNHMLGHIYGAWLTHGQKLDQNWPKLALLVSGAHTELILMESHQKLYKVGWTLDDAVGEAFDKVARLLGFPYPGGPHLSKLATQGNPNAVNLPIPMRNSGDFNFSFSGLKTAVLNLTRQQPDLSPADIAASFQHVAIQSLLIKTQSAAHHFKAKEVILGGGVAANQLLRTQLPLALHPIPCYIPEMAYTTDNAAVIAAAAHYHLTPQPWPTIQADPALELPLINDQS